MLGAEMIFALEQHGQDRQDHPKEEEKHALLAHPALGLGIESRASPLSLAVFPGAGPGHGQSQYGILSAVGTIAAGGFKRLPAIIVRHNTPDKMRRALQL